MKKVCVNVSGLFVEMCLLAMMRYAAYLLLLAGPEQSGGPASNNGRWSPSRSGGFAAIRCRAPVLGGLLHPVP
jgi:hypothetical protein